MSVEVIRCRSIISALQGRVKYYEDQLNLDENNLTQGDLESMLDRIKSLYLRFDDAQFKLEELEPTEMDSPARDKFETYCRTVESQIRNRLHECDGSSVNLSNINSLHKASIDLKFASLPLPEVPLPKFDGSFLSWVGFRQTFAQRVHNETRVNTNLKFSYLEHCLRGGSAYHFIESIPNADGNYEQVWNALFKHYENQPRIRTLHMQALYKLEPIRTENNVRDLQIFIDSFWKQYNALKSLKVPIDQWDLILVFHVCQLVDPISRHQIEIKKPVDRDPTIQEVIDILSQRARVLETLAPVSSSTPKIISDIKKPQKSKYAMVVTGAQKPISCRYCNSDHFIYKCESFKSLSLKDRNQWIKEKKFCHNCFGTHHISKCKSKLSCYTCKKRHHSLLHNPSSFTNQNQYDMTVISSLMSSDSNHSNALPGVSAPTKVDGIGSSSEQVRNDHGSKIAKVSNSNPIASSSTHNGLGIIQSNVATDATIEKDQTICLYSTETQILLSTILIWIRSSKGTRILCRALLDSGSQSNFITENICQKLGVQRQSVYIPVTGINSNMTEVRHKVNVTIESRTQIYEQNLDFLVLPKITGKLPLHQVNFDLSNLPDGMELADPKFYQPERIDVLIGAEVFCDIFNGEKVYVCKELPPFQQSVFGYVVCGKVTSSVPSTLVSLVCCDVEVLRKEVQRFYQIEDVKTKNNFSLVEKACEACYVKNGKRNPDGRYSVSLPVKASISNLCDNKGNSLRQFYNLEKKLSSNHVLRQLYCQFMNEYLSLNHMQLTERSEPNISYFLPHYAVLKENSTTTKLRVVFNGSSKSSSGLSLNDALMTGPTIQQELFSILLRFRKYKIAISADIAKMYRQIEIDPRHRNLQQIWWRESQEHPLKIYQLKTVTYGTTSAPFLAITTLKQLASDEHQQFMKASQSLLDDFYVDDFLGGSQSVEEAKILKAELTALLAKGGFQLTKWSSNSKEVVPNQNQDLDNVVSTLGINWNVHQDTLKISLGKSAQVRDSCNPNKRMILLKIAQIFDPLGLCAPVIFRAKLFLQRLWNIPNLGWDDILPEPYQSEWIAYSEQIHLLLSIEVPRCIGPSAFSRIELHGFGDASEAGYGCCMYIRTLDLNGRYHCQLLCSKSRVAPLKIQTIPRLELCASFLLAQLYEKVQQSIQIKFDKVKLYTDSEVTLFRINSSPAKYATFVANRVSQIQDIAPPELWAHINSELNPADLVSRGLTPCELGDCDLWWRGPPFLMEKDESREIPKVGFSDIHDTEYRKTTVLLGVQKRSNDLIERFSDFNKLVRISALCLRFGHNLRAKTVDGRKVNELSFEEIDNALKRLIRSVQVEAFGVEINQLESSQVVKKQSAISKLSPFIDDTGLLRVGGRLENSLLSFDQRHQMLLPANHNFTNLLVRKEHVRNLHAGPQALLCFLRQRYWVIGGKQVCKNVVHKCIVCFKIKPRSVNQIMGQLPANRVQPSRPFEHVGVDFCGPFSLRQPIRSNVVTKGYIAIFICFTTKATHLEVVSDLSTQGFLAALRRFTSRRGRCANLYSDNATNFVGAQNELRELKSLFESAAHKHEILKYCGEEDINWQTIPPRSPHFGGLWEAAVKSAKYHLQRVMNSFRCTFEELNTFVTQIEACLNSRPLSSMSNDPSDISVLTPGHFLIGRPINAIPEPSLSHLNFNRLSRYQRIQYALQQFWKRWSLEYLSELQHRHKWIDPKSNVEIGSLVLLKDDSLPPMKWIMGRVVKIHPGSDGFVRVVTVQTVAGEFKRAISRICMLPVETDSTEIDRSIDESEGFRGFD